MPLSNILESKILNLKSQSKTLGFTLIEVLIVVAIIGILVVTLTMSMRGQRSKAEDARVKSDLDRLKVAFEDYYNDHNCYPPAEWFDEAGDCQASNLAPYLSPTPCNRKTNLPYTLETDATGCSWFKFYATLTNSADPSVQALCATGGSTLGNYCTGSSNVVCAIDCDAL